MNNERPTPETDAQGFGDGRHPWVGTDFARKLERQRDSYAAKLVASEAYEAGLLAERDEALELLASEKSTRNTIIAKGVELERQLEAMREAVKDAHGAISQCLKYILKLPLSGSDAERWAMDDAHHAIRKLQPFLND